MSRLIDKVEKAIKKIRIEKHYGDAPPGFEDPLYLELHGVDAACATLVPLRELEEKIDELKKALALCVGALEHPHDSTLVTHAITAAKRVLP